MNTNRVVRWIGAIEKRSRSLERAISARGTSIATVLGVSLGLLAAGIRKSSELLHEKRIEVMYAGALTLGKDFRAWEDLRPNLQILRFYDGVPITRISRSMNESLASEIQKIARDNLEEYLPAVTQIPLASKSNIVCMISIGDGIADLLHEKKVRFGG